MNSKKELDKLGITDDEGQNLLMKYKVFCKLAKQEEPRSREVPFILKYKSVVVSMIIFILLFLFSQITFSRYLKTAQTKNLSIHNLERQVKYCSELLEDGEFHELFPKISEAILSANQLFVRYDNNKDINRLWAKLIVLKFYAQTIRFIQDETGFVQKPLVPNIYTYDRINSTYPEYSEILSMINYFTELTELQKQYSQNPYNETKALNKEDLTKAKVILKMLKKDLSNNITTIKVDFNQFYSYLRLTLDNIENDLGIWESFWNNYSKSFFMEPDKREKIIGNLKSLFPDLEILREIDEVKSLSIGYWSYSYYPADFWEKITNLFKQRNITVKLIKYDNVQHLINSWLDQAFDICILEPYYSYDLMSSSEYTGIAFFNLQYYDNPDFYIVTYLSESDFRGKTDLKLLLNPVGKLEEVFDILSLPENSEFHDLKGNIADIDYETNPEKILQKIEEKKNDFTLMRKPVFDAFNNKKLNTIPIINKNKDYIVFSSILLSEEKKEIVKNALLEGNLEFAPFSFFQLEEYYKTFRPSPTFHASRISINAGLSSDDKGKLVDLLLQCGLTPSLERRDNSVKTLFNVEANLIKVKQNTDNPFLFIEFTVIDKNESSIFRTDVFEWDESNIVDEVLFTISQIGLYGTVIDADPGAVIARMATDYEIQEKTIVEFFKVDYIFSYSDSIHIYENLIKTGEGEVIAVYKNLFVAGLHTNSTRISEYNLVRVKK